MDDIYNQARYESMDEERALTDQELLYLLDADIDREFSDIKDRNYDDEDLKFSLEKDIFDLLRLRRALVNRNRKEAADIVVDMDTATRDMINAKVLDALEDA